MNAKSWKFDIKRENKKAKELDRCTTSRNSITTMKHIKIIAVWKQNSKREKNIFGCTVQILQNERTNDIRCNNELSMRACE